MMNIANPSIPWGDEWRPSRDFRRVSDLFTNRNLRAVAAFMQAAGADEDLQGYNYLRHVCGEPKGPASGRRRRIHTRKLGFTADVKAA